jgi:hypothetical protein
MPYTKVKHKLVFGVGENDVSENIYSVVGGKMVICRIYRCWSNMIGRCYSPRVQSTRPCYIGCRVDERWHVFSVFRDWAMSQEWQGKELDKDLIGDGIVYSPENCVFVPHEVNAFLVDGPIRKKGLPVGVSLFRNGKFKATIRNRTCGRTLHLGYYDTPNEARKRWLEAKAEQAIELASRQNDTRVSSGLLAFAERLKNETDEKTEIVITEI